VRPLAHPLVAGSLYVLFLGNLLLHGLWIWKHPVERACALLVAGLVVTATLQIRRRGGFSPRAVLDLMAFPDDGDRAVFAMTAAGRPAPVKVSLRYPDREETTMSAAGEIRAFSQLCSATFQGTTAGVSELRVWAHRMAADGELEGLAVLLTLYSYGRATRADAALSGGPIGSPLASKEWRVEMRMEGPHRS
jgi:hypothetical protein